MPWPGSHDESLTLHFSHLTSVICTILIRPVQTPYKSYITQHCGPNYWKHNFKMTTSRHTVFGAHKISPHTLTKYTLTKLFLNVKLENKNIGRHTAHTIYSWPNLKQWQIDLISDLMMIIRQNTRILTSIIREMGKVNTHLHILHERWLREMT